MLSAYVLIQTEVGKVAHVAQALSDLDGVQLAEDLAGPYDVIARVQAPGLDQLGGWWSSASRSWTASPAP
jgi:Lrp/AsnC ligand binding domain